MKNLFIIAVLFSVFIFSCSDDIVTTTDTNLELTDRSNDDNLRSKDVNKIFDGEEDCVAGSGNCIDNVVIDGYATVGPNVFLLSSGDISNEVKTNNSYYSNILVQSDINAINNNLMTARLEGSSSLNKVLIFVESGSTVSHVHVVTR